MKITESCVEFITDLSKLDTSVIVDAGRTCYKSNKSSYTPEELDTFIRKLIEHGHESVLEHLSFTVKFITDRAIANELVRHRIASFSQESTRYCNYSKDKFDNGLTCLYPIDFESYAYDDVADIAHEAYVSAENAYLKLLELGVAPENARCVLPLGLKTELVVTANIREWRHILKLRTNPAAHPDVRYLCNQILNELNYFHPYFVFDIVEKEESDVAA